MKALSLLIALHACLSHGEPWTGYRETLPKFQYKHLNHHVHNTWGLDSSPYTKKLSGGVFSPFFLPPNISPNMYSRLNAQVTPKNLYPGNLDSKATYAGNELLRNNGIQNNLSFNSRRTFGDDVDVNHRVKKINNFVYFLNKTNDGSPQSGQSYTSALAASSPGGRYWVNENNQEYKQSYWIPPRPSWDQQTPYPPNPFDINPDQNGFYPDNNNNDWNQLDSHQNECYDLIEIIRDLRVLLHKHSISEEKQSLRTLFKIIKLFTLSNNLQYASFSVVVREIGKILLNGDNGRNNLRENEIFHILQEFKNRELNHFLVEIRTNRNISLQVVVSKLALLLYRLKYVLIQRRYSQEIIRLVINRAVQWSVPLVGYYFEQECKIKTQQYIVQNLEVALNVKLESVHHVENVDELQVEPDFGGLGNQVGHGDLGGLGGLGDLGNSGNVGGLGSLLNQGGLGSLGNLGGLESAGGLGGPGDSGNLLGLGSLESTGGLGGTGNLVGPGGLGSTGGLGGPGNLVGPGGTGNLVGPGGLGSAGGLGGPGNLVGLGGLGSAGGLGGQGSSGNLLGVGDQGYLGGLGGPANSVGVESQGYVGGLERPGNPGGLGHNGHLGGLGGLGNQGNIAGFGAVTNQVLPGNLPTPLLNKGA